MRYAEVAVDSVTWNSKPYTYEIPIGLNIALGHAKSANPDALAQVCATPVRFRGYLGRGGMGEALWIRRGNRRAPARRVKPRFVYLE